MVVVNPGVRGAVVFGTRGPAPCEAVGALRSYFLISGLGC